MILGQLRMGACQVKNAPLGLTQSKNPYQKKLRWSKKGEGGWSQFFLLKVEKKQFFYGSPYVQIGQGIQNLGPLEIVEQCRGHWCTRGSKGAPGGSRVPPAPKRVIKQQNNGPKPWFKAPKVCSDPKEMVFIHFWGIWGHLGAVKQCNILKTQYLSKV